MPTAPPAHRPPGWKPKQAWQRKPQAKPKPLGRAWRELRLKAFARDGYRCRVCGRLCAYPEADHIVARSEGGQDVLGNVQTLCKPCHNDKTQREARRASLAG